VDVCVFHVNFLFVRFYKKWLVRSVCYWWIFVPTMSHSGWWQKKFRFTFAFHPLLLTSSGFIWLFSLWILISCVLRGSVQLLIFLSFIIILSLLLSLNVGTYLLPQLYCKRIHSGFNMWIYAWNHTLSFTFCRYYTFKNIFNFIALKCLMWCLLHLSSNTSDFTTSPVK